MSSETTRRAFIGTGMFAALALAGCGGSGSSASTGSRSGPREAAAGGPPKRVVSVYPSTVSPLYDFGIDPVGVYAIPTEDVSPRFRARWERATPVGEDGELDLVKIAALEPDLIVAADYEWNTNYTTRLARIAHTVVAPSTEWREATHAIAIAVDGIAKMAQMQKELEQRSAKIRSTFAKQLDAHRWDLLQEGGEGGEFLLYGPDSGPGGVLTGAGVRLAAGSAAVTEGEDASYSAIGETAGLEGIVTGSEIEILEGAGAIGYYANFKGEPKNEKILFAQPEYQELAAVRAGRTIPLAYFLPDGYGDALALLEELETGLRTIAAGDSAGPAPGPPVSAQAAG